MNRYEQRRQKLLQNEEVAAGYREMAAELELMRAILLRLKPYKHYTEPEHPEGKEEDGRGRE